MHSTWFSDSREEGDAQSPLQGCALAHGGNERTSACSVASVPSQREEFKNVSGKDVTWNVWVGGASCVTISKPTSRGADLQKFVAAPSRVGLH